MELSESQEQVNAARRYRLDAQAKLDAAKAELATHVTLPNARAVQEAEAEIRIAEVLLVAHQAQLERAELAAGLERKEQAARQIPGAVAAIREAEREMLEVLERLPELRELLSLTVRELEQARQGQASAVAEAMRLAQEANTPLYEHALSSTETFLMAQALMNERIGVTKAPAGTIAGTDIVRAINALSDAATLEDNAPAVCATLESVRVRFARHFGPSVADWVSPAPRLSWDQQGEFEQALQKAAKRLAAMRDHG